MTETTISEQDEARLLTEAAERYAARRGLRRAPLDEAAREIGAFGAGWNACREAAADEIVRLREDVAMWQRAYTERLQIRQTGLTSETTHPVCPETGAPMYRDVRPLTLTYQGESITIEMPGWYCGQSKESMHTGEDMQVSDSALNQLKARVESRTNG